jgi:hypothetical protein
MPSSRSPPSFILPGFDVVSDAIVQNRRLRWIEADIDLDSRGLVGTGRCSS